MMWHAVIVAAYGLTLIALVARFDVFRDVRTAFAFLAIWGRYLLAGLHEYTYPAAVAGVSPIALFTLGVALAGLLLVPPRFYNRYYLVPFYLAIGLAVLSGAVNGAMMGTLETVARWIFFLTIALLLLRAMQLYTIQHVLQALLLLTLTPLFLQFLGIPLGIAGTDVVDGATVYDGGYAHNGNFVMILMACLYVVLLMRWPNGLLPLTLTLLCMLGIVLANYRTAIIAALPVTGVYFIAMMLRGSGALVRPLIVFGVLVAVGGTFLALPNILPERYGDVLAVPRHAAELVKPPEQYTESERRLFTGRIYGWAQYIDAWLGGSGLNKLIGFGPGAYADGGFSNHPHNTIVRFLYELGLAGIFVVVLIFTSQSFFGFLIKDNFKKIILITCFAGIFILGLASVPLREMEGVMLLSILCATTWSYVEERVAARTTKAASPPAQRKILAARWRATEGLRRRSPPSSLEDARR